jgi:glucose/arabinose dehydrogenase
MLAIYFSLQENRIYEITENLPLTAYKDNPFVGVANAKEAIYTYGNRNPQGMIKHPKLEIWEHEHGPQGGDEINIKKRC